MDAKDAPVSEGVVKLKELRVPSMECRCGSFLALYERYYYYYYYYYCYYYYLMNISSFGSPADIGGFFQEELYQGRKELYCGSR